jgi:pyruvate/2-oxoglutarate dehydrogenase complex dihydrolipoamide dehydrogenase (E3) component
MNSYDYILIGTGQATGTILPKLIERELRIAVVEEDRVGGTCVNYGCTPTKTLVAAARAAHVVRRSGDFGMNVSQFSIDFSKVMTRPNDIRHNGSQGFQSWLEEVTDFYPGHAELLDAHTVQVGDQQILGEQIILHTGTHSRVPNFPGIDSVNYLDNKGLLDLEELPEHLVVVGGSYIALEFAQIFRRLGSKVTVIQRSKRIMSREDEDLAALALEALSTEGIQFHLETKITEVKETESGFAVHFTELSAELGEQALVVEGSHLFVAIGRSPNSVNLGLEKAGVEMDSRGFIQVDDYCRTSQEHIWALGDVNGRGAFTHTSVHDGQVFLGQIGALEERRISDRIPIHSMFIDPPFARVGMTEKEARASGKNVLIAQRDMAKISRAKEKSETTGRIKFFVEADTEQVLGCTIFGVGGDEIINTVALLMQAGLSYKVLQKTVLVHPTVAELLPWILSDLKPLV